jgi:hypothetical protein
MKMFRLKLAFIAPACVMLAGLAACHSSDKDADDQPDDFGQKTLQKHYENGDMNDYQYQQSLKQFAPSDPNAQKPADTSDTSSSATPAKSP